ncbi:MAG: tetratricopeptide repeat protein, partial [Armatimonadetes bacterium]|nr:tetratricopeptide repeat protein [Armatimonadota bacterium]
MSYYSGSLSLHRQRGRRAREEVALAAWLHSDIGRYMLVAAGGAVAGLAIAFASAVPALWAVQLVVGAATGAFALWLFEFLVAASYRGLAALRALRRRRTLLRAWRACQPAAEGPQADAGTLLRAGILMLLLGEHAGAVKAFRRVPVNAYTTRACYNNAAVALARQSRFDDARRAWATAVKDSPGDLDVELNLAHLRVETKGYGSALRHLRLAARHAGLDPRWRHLMAWLEWVEGNRAASLNLLRELTETADRPDPEVLCDYGVALAGHDHLAEALAVLNTAVHRRPDYGPALCNRGVVLSFLGHTRLALRDLRRAHRLEPEEALVENNLGVLYHRLGRGEHAEECFHAALRKRGPSAEARYNLAQLYLYQQRWEDALHMLNAALEQRADDLDMRVNRGCALYHLQDLLAAEEQFEAAATALYERSALVRHNLGLVYAGTGRPELALAMLRAAHNLEPELLEHQRGLAYAFHVSGHLDEALAAHREVHQQDH